MANEGKTLTSLASFTSVLRKRFHFVLRISSKACRAFPRTATRARKPTIVWLVIGIFRRHFVSCDPAEFIVDQRQEFRRGLRIIALVNPNSTMPRHGKVISMNVAIRNEDCPFTAKLPVANSRV